MEIKRLTMLLDALTTFLITHYYGRGNNVYQDQKVMLSAEEVKEMVDFATKQSSLNDQQKKQVGEIFLQFFDRASMRIKQCVPDSEEMLRLKSDFEKVISCYFEENSVWMK
ncbi:hypothetical protein [Saccharicrinis fermentans]|uniref:Uncharacterized protein n=1 Tax=Saccharicrinis fermentans DSM 9555 = JCM 21142 TaxID=869213 RepID=W7XUC1_9BACT|nr:hypothetical protein [Saccharicrinis fermentans]GAF01600.1 hypothetical protein JCM21142_212 [Saccharicrinis fermentans DSM 9555 = JCM 21142]